MPLPRSPRPARALAARSVAGLFRALVALGAQYLVPSAPLPERSAVRQGSPAGRPPRVVSPPRPAAVSAARPPGGPS